MKLIKENKVTFEYDMPNIETEINHHLLTQTIENSNHMEYFEQTVKLVARVLEDLRNITMEKVASFAQGYFMFKGGNVFVLHWEIGTPT